MNKKKYLEIAISDTGIGYYESIVNTIKKSNNEEKDHIPATLPQFFNSDEFLKSDDHAKGIIESIFYRLGDKRAYGIYHIINDIIPINGIIRIHSFNSQIVLTKKNAYTFIQQKPSKDQVLDLYKHLNKLARKELLMRYKPVRKYENKFAGSHIEIEIPIAESIK